MSKAKRKPAPKRWARAQEGLTDSQAVSLATMATAVLFVETAAEGLRQVEVGRPDLVLLDLGLPDGDGESLLTQLRREQATPVIVISARHGDEPKVRLLDAGADDYLVKPFSLAELLARMRVALRHRGTRLRPAIVRYARDGLEVDLQARQARVRRGA